MIFEEKYLMSTLENSTLLIPDPQTETESIFDDILTGLNTEELQNWEDLEEQIDITDLLFSRKKKVRVATRGGNLKQGACSAPPNSTGVYHCDISYSYRWQTGDCQATRHTHSHCAAYGHGSDTPL